jgi:hypothetical protein
MVKGMHCCVPDNKIYQRWHIALTLFQQQRPLNRKLTIVTVTLLSLSVEKQIFMLIILFEEYSLNLVEV